jgi:cellulose synthase/poly-beta-1,6-N-acetylglucosamine synthase-like glycosyltransferase
MDVPEQDLSMTMTSIEYNDSKNACTAAEPPEPLALSKTTAVESHTFHEGEMHGSVSIGWKPMLCTGKSGPIVSVIVPVYNEAPRLHRNFNSILGQENAPPFEVIYVDNCSTDGSWEILAELASGRTNVRVEHLPFRRSVGAVRRTAVSLANGDVIANLDADCEPPRDWLSYCTYLTDEIAIVGFPNLPPPDLEYLDHKFAYVGTGQYSQGNLAHGCGALIRRDLLAAAGSFPDVSLGEDTKLFDAITRIGGKVVLLHTPAIRILNKRVTLGQHLERYRQMGINSDARSRGLYTFLIAWTCVAIAAEPLAWTISPWLAGLVLVVTLGAYTDPKRIVFYVRNFRLPSNSVGRAVCFTLVKFLETGALLSGFVSSLGRKKRASERLSADERGGECE